MEGDNNYDTLKAGITSVDNSSRSGFWQKASSVVGNLLGNMLSGNNNSSNNDIATPNFADSSYHYQPLEQPQYHSPYENYKAPDLITHTAPDASNLRAQIDTQMQAYKAGQSMLRNQMRSEARVQKQQYLPMREAIKQDLTQRKLETKLGLLEDLNNGLHLDSNLSSNYPEVFNQTWKMPEHNAYTQQAMPNNLIASNVPEVSPFEPITGYDVYPNKVYLGDSATPTIKASVTKSVGGSNDSFNIFKKNEIVNYELQKKNGKISYKSYKEFLNLRLHNQKEHLRQYFSSIYSQYASLYAGSFAFNDSQLIDNDLKAYQTELETKFKQYYYKNIKLRDYVLNKYQLLDSNGNMVESDNLLTWYQLADITKYIAEKCNDDEEFRIEMWMLFGKDVDAPLVSFINKDNIGLKSEYKNVGSKKPEENFHHYIGAVTGDFFGSHRFNFKPIAYLSEYWEALPKKRPVNIGDIDLYKAARQPMRDFTHILDFMNIFNTEESSYNKRRFTLYDNMKKILIYPPVKRSNYEKKR